MFGDAEPYLSIPFFVTFVWDIQFEVFLCSPVLRVDY